MHNSLTMRSQAWQMQQQVSSESWSFLDGVYLITTDKSNNIRLEQTRAALRAVNLLDKVKVKTFKTDDEDRVRGCYTSHIKVLEEVQREFQRKKDYKVLILEDNLEITPGMSQAVLQSVETFTTETAAPWDVFHLAYMMYVPGLKLLQLNRNALPSSSGSFVYLLRILPILS